MLATRAATSPNLDRKRWQDLLDALTRPNKWISDPPAVTKSSTVTENLPGNSPWTTGDMDHSATGSYATTGPTQTRTFVHTESSHGGPTFLTSPEPDVDGKDSPNLWYTYGISITVAILVLVVAAVVFVQCMILYKKRLRRKRVDFFVNRPNRARDNVFESFQRQEASMSRTRLESASTLEEIPLRRLFDIQKPSHTWREPPAGRAAEPLARVYPLHPNPSWDVNANVTKPFPCESRRRLWNTTSGAIPIPSHRTVVSEPVIARPSSRRCYSTRRRVRKFQTRSDLRLPRFSLSGKRIVTPPEFEAINPPERPNRPVRENRPTSAERSTLLVDLNTPTPKLVVPTNTPNTQFSESPPPENTPPCGPGLDSDFGASAGIRHFTVSPDNSMNVTDTSVRDVTFEWDSYDPAYRNRTVRYVDGAFLPVLQLRQYWV